MMIELFFANLKMMLRDRQRLFWNIMFPVMFTVIFGFFFGQDQISVGKIALINHSPSELAKTFEQTVKDSKLFKLDDNQDIDQAKKLIKKNELSAIIEVPASFGEFRPDSAKQIKIIYDPANINTSTVIINFVNTFLTQASFKAQNSQQIFTIDEEKTATNSFNYFDFILMGMLGMALMNSSIQGISIVMAQYKEDQILKRLTTTPLPVWKFIASEVMSRLILNAVQVSVILAIGVFGFNATIYGNIALIYLVSLLGAVLFQAIGFAVASLTNTTQAAEGMSVAISIPMMFLGGVFFPIDQLPIWLYNIVKYLPLSPLLRMIRQVGLESVSALEDPMNLAIVAGWIIIALLIAGFRFKLAEE